MKMGTKSLLFGVHQFIWHPVLVTISWIILYKELPSFKELVCIFIHDWGYWGVEEMKDEKGDLHPWKGAEIAFKLFGEPYRELVLGHSTFFCKRFNWKASKLMAADKYWHLLVPLWVYKLMSIPSGEFAYYRSLKSARQVADSKVSDIEWWINLQKTCLEKINGSYVIKE
jgi:hypothetical protein